MPVTRTFTNFSGFQYHAMFQFAKAAQESELEVREAATMSFVLGAITSSVAFLEALINEVLSSRARKLHPTEDWSREMLCQTCGMTLRRGFPCSRSMI